MIFYPWLRYIDSRKDALLPLASCCLGRAAQVAVCAQAKAGLASEAEQAPITPACAASICFAPMMPRLALLRLCLRVSVSTHTRMKKIVACLHSA